MIVRAVLERDVVIVACAISAGIHTALVPSHLEEGNAAAGFAASAVLLGVLAVAVTRNSRPLLFAAAAAVFTGLIASYALAVTTGVRSYIRTASRSRGSPSSRRRSSSSACSQPCSFYLDLT